MRALFSIGIVVLLLGIASLFIPIPHRERHGFDAGGISVGVTTTQRERVHPAISAVLIAGGVVMMIVGTRKGR